MFRIHTVTTKELPVNEHFQGTLDEVKQVFKKGFNFGNGSHLSEWYTTSSYSPTRWAKDTKYTNHKPSLLNIYTIGWSSNILLINRGLDNIIIDQRTIQNSTGLKKYFNHMFPFMPSITIEYIFISEFFSKDIYDNLTKKQQRLIIPYNEFTRLINNGLTVDSILQLKTWACSTIQNNMYIIQCFSGRRCQIMSNKGLDFLAKELYNKGKEFYHDLFYEIDQIYQGA